MTENLYRQIDSQHNQVLFLNTWCMLLWTKFCVLHSVWAQVYSLNSVQLKYLSGTLMHDGTFANGQSPASTSIESEWLTAEQTHRLFVLEFKISLSRRSGSGCVAHPRFFVFRCFGSGRRFRVFRAQTIVLLVANSFVTNALSHLQVYTVRKLFDDKRRVCT